MNRRTLYLSTLPEISTPEDQKQALYSYISIHTNRNTNPTKSREALIETWRKGVEKLS